MDVGGEFVGDGVCSKTSPVRNKQPKDAAGRLVGRILRRSVGLQFIARDRATPSWGGAAAAPAADITLRNAIRNGMENRARAAGRMWVKYMLHTLWVRSAKIYNAAAS